MCSNRLGGNKAMPNPTSQQLCWVSESSTDDENTEIRGHMLQRGPPPPDPKSGRVEAPDPTSEPALPLPSPSMSMNNVTQLSAPTNSIAQCTASTNNVDAKKESTALRFRRPRKPQRLLLHNGYLLQQIFRL